MKFLATMTQGHFHKMVIDTSALIAILLGEAEAEIFAKVIVQDSKRLLSAFSALEASVVIEVKMGEVILVETRHALSLLGNKNHS